MSFNIRSTILTPDSNTPSFTILTDGFLSIKNGKITAVEEFDAQKHNSYIDLQDHFIMPGFVDSHIHFPQTKIIGSASGPLLPWLNNSVFPEESQFSSRSYAAEVGQHFCKRLLKNGTIAAGIYSSAHHESTDELCKAIRHHGLKSIVGMTLMDRNAPPEICKDVAYAKDHSEELIHKWHNYNNGQIQYCITPRFAIACSSKLLKLAGDLSNKYDLWMQTHLSENTDEVSFAAELFPDSSDYLNIYEAHGLLHEKSIFAHCIYLSDSEWQRLIDAKAVVAHCADSNFFLGSGIMPLSKAHNAGARITMGSDVGAGRSFSLRITTSRSYDASLLLNATVSPEQLLYHATAGGQKTLGFGSPLRPDSNADFIIMRRPDNKNPENLLDHIIFNQEITTVEATLIEGRVRYCTEQIADILNVT